MFGSDLEGNLCWLGAEFDALTGCKLSSIDIGAPVVRMAYSPAGGHIIVAVLEVLAGYKLGMSVQYVRTSQINSSDLSVPVMLPDIGCELDQSLSSWA